MEEFNTDLDPRRQAMFFYWQGFRIARIAEMLGEKPATVHSWKRRDDWGKYTPLQQVEMTTAARYNQLIGKGRKEPGDFKEIDLLGRQMERHARIGRFGETGKERDLNPNVERRSDERQRPTRNHFTEEQVAALHADFMDIIRPYQKKWYDAKKHTIRNVLKTRQCGATWYFGREALDDALITGKNKIFLSASKSQAMVFKREIMKYAWQFGVKLSGNPIILSNGVELHFLGTNSATAQSYNGDLYVDEYFWIAGFSQLENTASGMATLDDMHLTFFSTPSTYTHEAYAFWSGASFNNDRPKSERVTIPLTHDKLKNGVLCADGQWRQMLTIEDAVKGGMRASIDKLKKRRGTASYGNLYMCQFIDDELSVFPLKTMKRCMVDAMDCWGDFKPYARRPYGDQPVWIGYDPSSTGDTCAVAVVAPPQRPGQPFRVLEYKQWHEPDFQDQADTIEEYTAHYNVAYIGIDETGLGRAVAQLVRKFYPAVEAMQYTAAMKVDLVHKARAVIESNRLEFDCGALDIAQAFMSIRKVVTPSGKYISYETGRADGVSHGDVGWAVMHALIHEPMTGFDEVGEGFMEMY